MTIIFTKCTRTVNPISIQHLMHGQGPTGEQTDDVTRTTDANYTRGDSSPEIQDAGLTSEIMVEAYIQA